MTSASVPALAPRVSQLLGSVYSHLASRFCTYEGERYPLHVGDTWLLPPEGCRTEDVTHADHPGVNTYTAVPGWEPLREGIRQRVAARTGVPVASDEVLVAAGATAALACALGAVVGRGQEVMILAPAWPLIAGMTTAFGGTPVHVPFLGVVDQPEQVAEALDRAYTPATVAVYVNTPNNPSGLAVSKAVLAAIAAWARRRNVWIVSDEVYEDLQFVGQHHYIRSMAPERTVSAWSFSKGFGMAGNRCGYLVGPAALIAGATKLATYTFYCAPRVAQDVGLRALSGAGDAWVSEARDAYRAIGNEMADRLGVARPQGSTFLFVDLSSTLNGEPLVGFLEAAVAQGVLVAPGSVFGPYPNHIRVCFTAVEPERTRAGVEILAGLL